MPKPAPDSTGLRLESVGDVVERVVEELQQRGPTPEMPTGLTRLDEAIWGLHRGEVTVIAARPGTGKTSMALQFCRNLADAHKKIVFVSLEMTSEQLVERLLVQMTQSDAWNLRRGETVKEFIEKITPLQPMWPVFNLRFVDGFGYTVPQINYLMQKLIERTGSPPDLLVVDFVQLIALEEGQQRFDAIAEYLRALKELAMRHHMAVVVCSQINREQEKTKDKRPRLDQLKGSGALEELSDAVVLLWWEELGNEENPQGNRYWALIAKQRHGPPGQAIPIRFDPHRLTFHDVQDEIPEWHEDGVLRVSGQDAASGDSRE